MMIEKEKIDAIKVYYKGKNVFINRNLLYDLRNREIPAFEDIELKKPFKIRKSINIFSDKIELKIPALELINYV